MRELPNDRPDFARKQGYHADHTEKTGDIPYPRATNREEIENEWSEKERKTKTKMAGHTQGAFERSHHQQHETRRQR